MSHFLVAQQAVVLVIREVKPEEEREQPLEEREQPLEEREQPLEEREQALDWEVPLMLGH